MTVVRQPSAASRSRHADVAVHPYSGRSGTARPLQPKYHAASHTQYQSFDQALSPASQLRSPLLFSSSPLSPGAFSWASGESSDSGTSYELARKRGVYTTVHTPTSSTEASPIAEPDTSTQSYHFWSDQQRYAAANQPRPPSDPSYSPPVALSGLGLPLNHNSVFDAAVYPSHNVDLLQFQATSPKSRPTRPGVRWRPLSPDARENAGAVRDSGGSCIRCTIMRERCDTEVPCSRCVTVAERARSWKLPCSRKWLNERGTYLLPDPLTSHLTIDKVNEFVNNSTFFPLENSRLQLPLWVGFGKPLVLDAMEVDPYGPNLTLMRAFGAGGPVSIQSPPIVPQWPVDLNAIYTSVRSWMQDLLTESPSIWPDHLFHPSSYPPWLGEILTLILQHYHTSTTSPHDDTCILTTTLRLSIAVYVMSHTLTVPPQYINSLFQQLHHADFQSPSLSDQQNTWVTPRAVNRVVKAIVMHMVRHLVEKTAEHIHAQLGPKTSPQTACFESAFTASFLTLTVAAMTQTSVYECAEVKPDFGMEAARQEINMMEKELTLYVVHLFVYKYRPKRKNGKDGTRSPSSASTGSSDGWTSATPTFREQLQGILQRHKEIIRAAEKELGGDGEFEEKLFEESGRENMARVLARLCAPLIEE